MSHPTKIVALGLLSQTDLDRLGGGFRRSYPITDVPCFGELLHAIDVADRECRRSRGMDVADTASGPTE